MEYRHLGSSGLRISTLSLGAWVTFGSQVDEDVAEECMRVAFDAGVNFFDNAEAYARGKAEEVTGRIIRKAGWKRSDLIISTKVFWGGSGPNEQGLSRKHVIEGALAALDRLQMKYVDLIFCHRPDHETPIEETVRAMSHLVDRGKAFYWGTSEWSGQQIRQAHAIARQEHLVPPTMEQPQYHMFHRDRVEREYLGLYEDFGMGTTIWSPLASGVLTGKYNDGVPKGSRLDLESLGWLKDELETDEGRMRIEKVKKLQPVAKKLEGTMAQLALAWCVRNPHVSTVMTGASRPEQVRENLKALELVKKLTPEVMAEIEEILDNKPEPDRRFRSNG
ncbi:MAG: aldo/keto reductase [Planctomycetota bacterium]|nr:aldo/keto reductase [Planctomycetota bacterium]